MGVGRGSGSSKQFSTVPRVGEVDCVLRCSLPTGRGAKGLGRRVAKAQGRVFSGERRKNDGRGLCGGERM